MVLYNTTRRVPPRAFPRARVCARSRFVFAEGRAREFAP